MPVQLASVLCVARVAWRACLTSGCTALWDALAAVDGPCDPAANRPFSRNWHVITCAV